MTAWNSDVVRWDVFSVAHLPVAFQLGSRSVRSKICRCDAVFSVSAHSLSPYPWPPFPGVSPPVSTPCPSFSPLSSVLMSAKCAEYPSASCHNVLPHPSSCVILWDFQLSASCQRLVSVEGLAWRSIVHTQCLARFDQGPLHIRIVADCCGFTFNIFWYLLMIHRGDWYKFRKRPGQILLNSGSCAASSCKLCSDVSKTFWNTKTTDAADLHRFSITSTTTMTQKTNKTENDSQIFWECLCMSIIYNN